MKTQNSTLRPHTRICGPLDHLFLPQLNSQHLEEKVFTVQAILVEKCLRPTKATQVLLARCFIQSSLRRDETQEAAGSTQAGFDDPFFSEGGDMGGFGDFDAFRRHAEGHFRRYVKGWSPFGKSSGTRRDKYRCVGMRCAQYEGIQSDTDQPGNPSALCSCSLECVLSHTLTTD